MDMKYDIRTETKKDNKEVEKLTFAAFETMELPGREFTSEHFFVHLLRNDKTFIPELDFVIEVNGEIVGNIMYNRSSIITSDSVKDKVLALAVLSVKPELQKQGIGSGLIKHSMEIAKELGYKAIVILGGHPEYYSRFGFAPASTFGLKWIDGSELDAFLALELEEGYLGTEGGSWEFCDSIHTLMNEDAFNLYKVDFEK